VVENFFQDKSTDRIVSFRMTEKAAKKLDNPKKSVKIRHNPRHQHSGSREADYTDLIRR